MNTISIAGVKIYNASLSSLLSDIKTRLTPNAYKLTTILTVNPEIVVQAQDDSKLREILNKSWAAIPDGVGILWAAKIQKKSISERITGVRLTQELLEIAQKQKLTIGVVGGTEQTSLKYQKYLNTLFPNAQRPTPNAYSLPGPWIEATQYKTFTNELYVWFGSIEGKEFLDKLEKTDILFVAMGAPKQEFFIDFLSQRPTTKSQQLILVAVGGTFDELAGITPKSPEWIDRAGLKWLFRLTTEPWRFKRQTRLFRFIRLITTNTK